MRKLLDMIIFITLNLFGLIICYYKMLVSSNIPVEVSVKDVTLISMLLILYLAFYRIYLKKTKYLLINFSFLLIPLSLWSVFMYQALTYSYHPNDTIISIIGFLIVIITILQIDFKRLKSQVQL